MKVHFSMGIMVCAAVLAAALAAASAASAVDADEKILVNVDNFARAQTDMEFEGILKLSGDVN
jgi:spore coat protein U-like protein